MSVGFPIRDRNLLLLAVAAPLPVFGEEVYMGRHDKAGTLMRAINRDHPLTDGDERLSWLPAKGFLAHRGRAKVRPLLQRLSPEVTASASRWRGTPPRHGAGRYTAVRGR